MVIKIYKRLVCPAYSQKISSELSINHGQPLTSHNSNAYNESHDDSFPLPSWWAHCFWFPNPHGAVGIWIEMISRWWIHICVFIFNPNPTWGNARKKKEKKHWKFPHRQISWETWWTNVNYAFHQALVRSRFSTFSTFSQLSAKPSRGNPLIAKRIGWTLGGEWPTIWVLGDGWRWNFSIKCIKDRKKYVCMFVTIVFCFLYARNYDCATAVCWLLFYMYVFMLCPWVLGPQIPKPPKPSNSQSSREGLVLLWEKRGMATNHNATVNLCQQRR